MSTLLQSQAAKDVTLTVNVASGTNYFIISAINGNVEITLDGIYFANSSYTSDGTQSKTITAGTSQTVYVTKATGKMYIKHAQYVNVLQFDSCFAASSFNITQLSGCVNLTKFTWYTNYNVYGDIAVFKTCPKLSYLNIYQTNCKGNISAFAELTFLTYLDIRYTSVFGDIAHLSRLINLTDLRLSVTECYGDIIDISKCKALTTLSIQFTDIGGNLHEFYQSIGPKLTLWYCLPMDYFNSNEKKYNPWESEENKYGIKILDYVWMNLSISHNDRHTYGIGNVIPIYQRFNNFNNDILNANNYHKIQYKNSEGLLPLRYIYSCFI